MNRREILNELAQIVALTDPIHVNRFSPCIPEAARRAKGLIQVVESWPIAFPPAPFVSDQCCERKHAECLMKHGCKCACHCPPEAPQQPAEPAFKDQQRAADSRFIAAHAAYIRNQNETTLYEFTKAGMAAESVQSRETPAEAPQQPAEPTVPPICPACGQAGLLGTICPRCYFGLDAEPTPEAPRQPTEPAPPTLDAFLRKINQNNAEAPQQPAEPAPATERHIDTPGELLELLAGISSDPQVEGLSLSQKASTMALLYAAKALQQIADSQGHFDSGEIADAILIACGNLHEDSPQEPS